MNQSVLSLPSFAKINWSLQILGRRPDGYHEVRTLLQTISLHDDLHFEVDEGGGISLSCDEPDIPTDDQNLIMRAASALKKHFNVAAGVRVHLEKRIPARAGLGGGSSNAAVSLLALTRLWKIEASATQLLEIATTLGADVPFFLVGGCAQATGIGATISPVPENTEVAHLIVITPNASISTAKAYSALGSTALTTLVNDPILSSSHSEAKKRDSQPWPLRNPLQNDFESVIFDIEPEIRRTKETLLQAGALDALMAGSGSSVFGIFINREDQQRALNKIKPEEGWRIFPCVTVSRNEYRRVVGPPDIPFPRSFNSGPDIGA
ncbi:MAG TPA: 4-(cytidine 5'-diphospho)-2-C-methyl-D-erythritol kinase [Pyrinomonadaceae bacterium]|nr:4-(cytidine 5'-diphospho)-2-C-methyl-D-erythritol kinase [Pyrinomonadaceae bacterium]